MAYSNWKRRVPHIQGRIWEGATPEQLADEYDVSPKTIKNRVHELENDPTTHLEVPDGWYRLQGGAKESPQPTDEVQQAIEKFGVQREIDGRTLTHKSTRLLEMSETDDKDPDFLLRAHKYDPNEWDLLGSKSKIWHVYSKIDKVQTLYSSSISVKPKVQGWSIDDLVSVIREDVKPVQIVVPKFERTDRMLELSFYDSHFGNATYDDYRETQQETYELIMSRQWAQILISVGSDMFHVDNFNSTTVSGTQLETTDLPSAWRDCVMFYDALYEAALKQSKSTKSIYVPGNHDSSIGWTFAQYIKTKYPQVEVDDRVKHRKVHVFGRNFLAFSHGEKSRKDLIRIIPAEFPLEWAQTDYREAHIGHLHREEETRAKDEFGLTVRTLCTANPIDKYHDDEGYVTAHKRFQLFEYSANELKDIHYV